MDSKKSIQEKLDFIRSFTLMDDVFFEAFAQNVLAIQEMLRTILEEPELIVVEVTTQDAIPNLYGRSVRLDAVCRLGDGRITNVEIQNSDNDNHVNRAGFNAAHIVVRESQKGTKFEDLPHIISVYIMKFDFFGLSRLAYHANLVLKESGKELDSNVEYIFINATADDNTKLARLVKLMQQKEVNDPEFPEITRQVNHLKHDEKGVQQMCDLMEKYMAEGKEESREEGRREGRSEGRKENRKEMLVTALKGGISVDQLISVFNATEEEIRECENEMK